MDKRYFTLLFTTPKKFKLGSFLIRWRLKKPYSHVCGVVSTGPIGLFDLYQASHGDVNDIDLENFLKENIVLKSCRIGFEDKEDYYSLIRYLKKQRGKDYSEWGALASTFSLLRKLKIGKNGDSEFMCSEYMARALETTGIIDKSFYKIGRGSADYVDPEYFELMLKDAGFEIYNGIHLPESNQ